MPIVWIQLGMSTGRSPIATPQMGDGMTRPYSETIRPACVTRQPPSGMRGMCGRRIGNGEAWLMVEEKRTATWPPSRIGTRCDLRLRVGAHAGKSYRHGPRRSLIAREIEAIAAVERVGTAPSFEQVVASPTVEDVVAGIVDKLHTHLRVRKAGGGFRCRKTCIEGHGEAGCPGPGSSTR
jgi:hypothetical protein